MRSKHVFTAIFAEKVRERHLRAKKYAAGCVGNARLRKVRRLLYY